MELVTREAGGQEQWLICFVNICPGLLLDTRVTEGDCLFKLWNSALYMKSPISVKQATTGVDSREAVQSLDLGSAHLNRLRGRGHVAPSLLRMARSKRHQHGPPSLMAMKGFKQWKHVHQLLQCWRWDKESSICWEFKSKHLPLSYQYPPLANTSLTQT